MQPAHMMTPARRLEQILRPKEVLDLKGLIMHAYHGARDPNAVLSNDGHTLIKRAAHGLEAFWERYLQPMLARTAPIDIVAVLDSGNDLRTSIYPEYKAKRKQEKEKQDPRLTEQLDILIKETTRLLQYIGCTVMEVPKLEADDVIAMICHKYPGQVVVHTRDLDLVPLACLPNVTVFWQERLVDPEEPVHLQSEDVDLLPRHVVLFKTLCGDKSDEYKGVRGVGPKAWQYLEKTYKDEGLAEIEKAIMDDKREDVLDAATLYGDKVLMALHQQWDQARMCFKLATLHPAWCWMARGGKLLRPIYHKRLPNAQKVRECLEKLDAGPLFDEFKEFLSTETLVDANWLDDKRLARIKNQFEGSPAIGFDTEGYDKNQYANLHEKVTGGKDYVDTLSQTLTGASFTFGRNLQHTIYVPVAHRDTANLPLDTLTDLLQTARAQGKLLIAHNSRFEQGIIQRDLGLDIPDWEDSLTSTSYFDESLMEGHNGGGNLKEVSLQVLRHVQVKFEEVMEASGATDMRGVSGEQVLHYGCDDALTSAHNWVVMSFAVALEQQITFIQENDILPCRLLNRSHEQGMNIDLEELEKQKAADRILVDEGMIKLRAWLEEHCLEVETEERNLRATRLLESDREFHEMSLRAKFEGVGSEKLKAELQTIMFKMVEDCTYKPLQAVPRTVTFVPTTTQILEVARHLGLPKGEQYEMASTAGKRLLDWMIILNDLVYNSDTVFEPQIEEFMKLLGAAASHINKRQGPEYEAFHKFCQDIQQKHAKVDMLGDELNLDSAPQMQALLYLKLGLPVRVRSKVQRGSTRDKWRLQGSPATNEKAITAAIAEDCPEGDWRRDFLKLLGEVKGALTRFEGIWDPYPVWIRPDTEMIHPGVKNNGTVTRRPTGGNPNALAFDKGPPRRIVIPRYNRHVIVSIDFSGQELRITGSEARDPAFIEAYTGGGTYVDEYGMTRQNVKDVHSVTGVMFAMEVFSRELSQAQLSLLDLDEFGRVGYGQFRAIVEDGVKALGNLIEADGQVVGTDADGEAVVKAVNKVRKMAKAVNFLICYLGTAGTLAQNIGVPKAFAEKIMAAVFGAYTRLSPWQDETIAFARKNGFVTTAFGTWKHVSEDILSKDGGKRSRAERQAVNQTIQGCAADILKVVMTKAENQSIFVNPRQAVMHLPIYDEIMSSVHMDYCFEYVEKMQDIMNLTPPGHPIPMMGEVSIGLNWWDQEELGDRPAEKKITNLFEKWAKDGSLDAMAVKIGRAEQRLEQRLLAEVA